jgi:hypothetical protein
MATKVNINANVQSDSKTGITGEKSLKSLRTYQLGVVYKDKYGRETPVFTNEEASFTVPKKLSDVKNSITTSIKNQVPDWVDSYKFFIKETSNEYYNLCMDRWYDAEDGNLWISFPSAERNKVNEDTFLILKKQAGDGGEEGSPVVHEEGRYRVIDIQNEAPRFIKTKYEKYGSDVLGVLADGAVAGGNVIKLNFDGGGNDWESSVFWDKTLTSGPSNDEDDAGYSGLTETGFVGWPLEDVVVDLQTESQTERTGWLDVSGMYVDGSTLNIQLSKAFKGENNSANANTGAISAVIPCPTTTCPADDVIVKLAKKVVKNKPEFEGRFFVKIRMDGVIEDKIRSVGNPTPSFNVQNSISQYYINKVQNLGQDYESFWESVGETWFIDMASRRAVGTCYWSGNDCGTAGVHDEGSDWPEDSGFGMVGNESNQGTLTWDDSYGNQVLQRGSYSTSGSNNTTVNYGNSHSSLRCTMELSLNDVKDYGNMGFDISNNTSENQEFLNKMASTGTMFRWAEDPYRHIYKIVKVKNSLDGNTNYRGILNFSSKNHEKEDPDNKCARLYITFKTTGWRLDLDQSDSAAVYTHYPDEEDKYPFAYKNYTSTGYDPPEVSTYGPWDPTRYGYGGYTSGSVSSPDYTSLPGPGTSPHDHLPGHGSGFNKSTGGGNVYNNTIQIIDTQPGDGDPVFSADPAIWETEPKEDKGLDIYYEASQAYPLSLNNMTNELFAPYGSVVVCKDTVDNKSFYLPENTQLWDWAPTGHGGDTIVLDVKTKSIGIIDNTQAIQPDQSLANPNPILSSTSGIFDDLNDFYKGIELRFIRQDGSYTTAKVNYFSAWSSLNIFINPNGYVGNNTERVLLKLDRYLGDMNIKLPYFNCYTFGNGVESDRIRDDFNAIKLDKGVKASTVLDEPYEEEQRTNGLIYSGIYNSTSGVNNLNQFIAGEKITKDTNPSYGSIQKLKTRDTNLVTFCEDKVLKIMANKDALYSADLKPQLIASNAVLGNVTSFAGEFGISKNPESFAEEAFRMYFTDKQRGKVLRLSGDGITDISNVGMKDYFADNLKLNNILIGSFDDRKEEYNLTLKDQGVTVAFSETAKGWTSFKSFVQDGGLSLNNDYYTLKEGELWKHHSNETRNNFYGGQYDSHVDILFNEESATVKSFGSMKYEGSQAKITQNLGTSNYPDNEYYNNIGKTGWYVESGETDLQLAGEMEFKDKEGKWFSYMKGVPVENVADLNSEEFSFQGIDIYQVDRLGCMNPEAENYDPLANLDCAGISPTIPWVRSSWGFDDSCCCTETGCMDDSVGYYPMLEIFGQGQDRQGGFCSYPCTDDGTINGNPIGFAAINYDPKFDCDAGCIYPSWYCYDYNCFEHDPAGADPNWSGPYTNELECQNSGCVSIPTTNPCESIFSVTPGTWDNGSIIASQYTITPGWDVSGTPPSLVYTCWVNITVNAAIDAPYTFELKDASGSYIANNNSQLQPTGIQGSSLTWIVPCNELLSLDVISNQGCTYNQNIGPLNTAPILGCTDPLATNYDPLATIDDGSCDYGCGSGSGNLLIQQSPVQGSSMNNANFTVTSYTETGIPFCSDYGWDANGATNSNMIARQLVITPNPGYTIQARDFGINNVTWAEHNMIPMNSTDTPGVALPTEVSNVMFWDSDLAPLSFPSNPPGALSTLGPPQNNGVAPSQNNEVRVIVMIESGELFPNFTPAQVAANIDTVILSLNITGIPATI